MNCRFSRFYCPFIVITSLAVALVSLPLQIAAQVNSPSPSPSSSPTLAATPQLTVSETPFIGNEGGLDLIEFDQGQFATTTARPPGYEFFYLEDLIPDGNFDISPTYFKINAEPGEVFNKAIYVTSRSSNPSHYVVQIEDYEGSQDSASSHILLDDKESPYGARNWITPGLTEFDLSLGDRIGIDLQIKVPLDADPGDHYAAVLVARQPNNPTETGGNQVTITSRIGTMFLINVAGRFEPQGHLEDFAVIGNFSKAGQDSFLRNWVKQQPFQFAVTYRNEGNVHLTPFGEITFTNIFGQPVKVVNPGLPTAPSATALTVNGFNVLRSAVRTSYISSTNDTEHPKLFFGPYTAHLTLDNGLGQIETTSTTFWYIPLPATAIALVLILILIVIVIIKYKKKARHQKRRSRSTKSEGSQVDESVEAEKFHL